MRRPGEQLPGTRAVNPTIASSPQLISRRSLIGAAVGAGALVCAPPVLAAGSSPGELFSRRLGELRGTSPMIEVGRTFALVGVHWRGPKDARILLRARLSDGRWTPWVGAGSAGHGPDAHESARAGVHAGGPAPVHAGGHAGGPARVHVGEPLWTGSARAVQLRTSVPVHDVTLHLVSDTVASTAAAVTAAAAPLAQPILSAGPGQPAIIARAAWSHGARPAVTPSYGAVRLGFVHHTDNPNGYGEGQVAALIYSIYLYHRYSNGWNDIGYNFVIDAFGRIWEARAGGIDLPVIGAHAGGYNLESTGVAILGTFSDVLPSAAAMSALEHLLAWKLSLHGIPTGGEVEVEVDPSDAFYTRFRPGQRISLPRVAGHRQGCTTDCPGNALFAQLPQVRRSVTSLAGQFATLSLVAARPEWRGASLLALADDAITSGVPFTVTGRLALDSGAPVAGAPVELQAVLAGGAEQTLASVTTDANGGFAATLTVAHDTILRALHTAAPAVVSPLLAVAAAPVVTLTLASTAPLRVTGTVHPAAPTATVALHRRGASHALHTRTAHVRHGAFAVTLPRPPSGDYTVLATVPATRSNAAGRSAPLAVTVS